MMEEEKESALDDGTSRRSSEDPEKQPLPETGHPDASGSKPTSNDHSARTFRNSPLVKCGAAALIVASLTGLVLGITLRSGGREDPSFPTAQEIRLNRLSYFDESVIRGYPDEESPDGDGLSVKGSGCLNFKEDLYEAVEVLANVTIDRQAIQRFHYNLWPFCPIARGNGRLACAEVVMMDEAARGTEPGGSEAMPPAADDSSLETSLDAEKGEDSYGTNNQVEGVDEADLVKSDGTHVFAAYGSELVVWDAITGDRLSTTELPIHDDDGYTLCADSTFPCYRSNYWWMSEDVASNPFQISSLLIHEDRLLVVAEARGLVLMEDENTVVQKTLGSNGRTRLFFYDIAPSNIPSDNSALSLVASKDINGRYQTGRKIGQHAHVVTSSSLDTWYHIDSKLSAWNKEFADMDEDEYRAEAYKMSLDLGRNFVDDLFDELAGIYKNEDGGDDPTCANIAKIALMMKSNESKKSTVHHLPSFTTSVLLQTFTQVYSIDLLQATLVDNSPDEEETEVAVEKNNPDGLKPTISLSASGAFFPTTSYTSNVYASADKLFIAGESYVEDDDGQWEEHTIFLVYDFKNNATEATAIGDVPGSLLNQFSMDHSIDDDTEDGHLRVATTSWARWGMADDGSWQQTDESESSVFVLKLSDGENGNGVMETVGSASGIGMGERIYAVRFMGDRGYIVTFRQIDPFYTLDLADHTNPVVIGELKIPGFSNYLHPISDDLILGLGQDADERGVVNGLQISLFDVSNFESPIQLRKFVEEGGSSTAQYEHKAFRYLPKSKLLILPVSTPWWNDDVEYFDGFVVYDVDETKDFEKKFSISHMDRKQAGGYCWSKNTLPSRSLVFNGDVTTLKGHNVYSHDLETGQYKWDLNLDDNRKKESGDYCSGWAWD